MELLAPAELCTGGEWKALRDGSSRRRRRYRRRCRWPDSWCARGGSRRKLRVSNRLVWDGTAQRFDCLTLTFRENGTAPLCHHYRYSPEMSTSCESTRRPGTSGLDRRGEQIERLLLACSGSRRIPVANKSPGASSAVHNRAGRQATPDHRRRAAQHALLLGSGTRWPSRTPSR